MSDPVIMPVPDEKKPTDLVKNEIIQIDQNAIMMAAVESNKDPAAIEKIVDMVLRLNAIAAKKNFNIALSRFQAECPEIEKKKKVDYTAKSGQRVKYEYAPVKDIVKQVKPLLEKHGLCHTYKTTQTDKDITVICEIRHIDGHVEQTPITMPIDNTSKMGAAQKVGTAFTYGWRYAFTGALGITTGEEDTDANGPADNTPTNKNNYPQNPKGNRPPRLSADDAKNKILKMLKEDALDVFSEDEKNEIRKRIATDRPYKGGWIALHDKVEQKILEGTPVF